MRLDKYLQKKLMLPYSLAQKALRSGWIMVDGAVEKSASFVVSEGREILLKQNLQQNNDQIASKEQKQQRVLQKYSPEFNFLTNCIVFEDENLFALNKPQGLAVQGGSGLKYSLDDFLLHLHQTNPAQYPLRPHITHRIDKETSGLVIFAKSPSIATMLGKLFETGQIEKTYLAIVKKPARPPQEALPAVLTCYIAKKAFKAYCSNTQQDEDFKLATTQILPLTSLSRQQTLDFTPETISEGSPQLDKSAEGDYLLLQLQPKTGRYHQLRSQLAFLNCPIVGDAKYGFGDFESNLKLFATKISFTLPLSSGDRVYNITLS